LLELTPDLSQPAQAVIIESHQDNRRGPVATALVQKGTLQVGDAIQANTTSGKIRTMTNDQGQAVKTAAPADPVELLGLKSVPDVGSTITVYPSEREAEAQAQAIKQQLADQADTQPAGPTDLSSLLAAPGQELKLIVKADTQGSLEAIVNSINQLESPQGTTVKFILAGTGNVSESDALLASTTNALTLAFRVKIDSPAQKIITQDKLLSQSYDIIYQLLEDVEGVLAGGVPTKEVPIKGRAEVLQVFPLKSGDIVAGCKITDGLMRKGWNVKVTRGEEVVVESAPIDEIRHGADKINEAKKNSECGLMLKPTFQFEVGDIIEAL
jgi:translation initiation factor IF-2